MDEHDDDTLEATGFEWDENKRLTNIHKHGIDFEDVVHLFFEPRLDEALSYPHEPRRKALGLVCGQFVTVIYTWRDTSIRIISARRARPNERRAYRALHDPGDS
jgi:uncharacterized DUF497 family protein